MITATTFRTNSAACRTKECMLIAFGLLFNAPALAAADSDLSQAYLAWSWRFKAVPHSPLVNESWRGGGSSLS